MKTPPQYMNHDDEWREEENRHRLGIPEDEIRFFEEEEENRFDRMEEE